MYGKHERPRRRAWAERRDRIYVCDKREEKILFLLGCYLQVHGDLDVRAPLPDVTQGGASWRGGGQLETEARAPF